MAANRVAVQGMHERDPDRWRRVMEIANEQKAKSRQWNERSGFLLSTCLKPRCLCMNFLFLGLHGTPSKVEQWQCRTCLQMLLISLTGLDKYPRDVYFIVHFTKTCRSRERSGV